LVILGVDAAGTSGERGRRRAYAWMKAIRRSKIASARSCKPFPEVVWSDGRNLRLDVRRAAGDIQTTLRLKIEPMCSSAKLGDLEHQFSADVASVDHLMPKPSLLQRKHIDGRHVDQATINQIGDLPHRLPSSVKVDNGNDLPESSPLGFLPIALVLQLL
jgi:hypothetical protein